MKRIWKGFLVCFLATTVFMTGCGQKETVEHGVNGEYELLWSDEFDGDTLNLDNWMRESRQPGYTNNELQAYKVGEENSFIRDGKLVLKAIKKENEDGSVSYSSGKVNSKNRQDFTYGRVEVSAKMPKGQGLWPAIWMMPTNEGRYGSWPRCGEIDIVEVLGHATDVAYCTLHYGTPHAEQQGTYILQDGDFSDSFHEFAVEWDPGEIRWYIDGNLVLTANDWFSATSEVERAYPAPFNQDFYVQMNLAVGGNWPGNPDETTDFDNAEMEIDYVRVYQRTSYDLAVTKPEKVYRKAVKGNLIYNGNFSENESLVDDENWKFMTFGTGRGSAKIEDGVMVIETVNAGDLDYSIQLVQAELPMLKGHKYRVTFEARSDAERDMIVCISAPTNNWVRYLKDTTEEVGTEWKKYTYEFTMNDRDDNNGRLEFNLGNHGYTDTVYIRNVVVKKIK